MKTYRIAVGIVAVTVAAALSACSADVDQSMVSPASTTSQEATARVSSPIDGTKRTLGDASTLSYRITSGDQQMPGLHTTASQTAECAAGYYVRAWGTPGAGANPRLPYNPTLELSGDTSNITFSSVNPTTSFGQPWQPYSAFKASFHNSTKQTKTIRFSWWCDKIPSWAPWAIGPLGKVESNKGTSGKAATGTPSSKQVGEEPDIDPFGPDTRDNPYDSKSDIAFGNGTNDAVWDNTYKALQEGNAIFAQPWNGGHNQRWYMQTEGFVDNNPAYSLWTNGDQPVQTPWQAVERFTDPEHPVVLSHSTSGALPGGVWAVIPSWMGPDGHAVQIVNLTSWQCATAPDGGFGQITTQPCDTTDLAQWWSGNYAK